MESDSSWIVYKRALFLEYRMGEKNSSLKWTLNQHWLYFKLTSTRSHRSQCFLLTLYQIAYERIFWITFPFFVNVNWENTVGTRRLSFSVLVLFQLQLLRPPERRKRKIYGIRHLRNSELLDFNLNKNFIHLPLGMNRKINSIDNWHSFCSTNKPASTA